MSNPARLIYVVLAAGLSALVISCEPKADLENIQGFSVDGISFSLPGNWSVTRDETTVQDGEIRHIYVESPGDALVILLEYTPGVDLTVDEFAAEYMRNVDEEAKDVFSIGPIQPIAASGGTRARIEDPIAGALSEGVEISFGISVLGEVVPHKCRIFKHETNHSDVFIISQVAEEDWYLVSEGFRLIGKTLEVD